MLKDPPNMNTLKVIIIFPDGERHHISFKEIQEMALVNSNLSLCSELLKHKMLEIGSLTYILIEGE